MIRVLMPLKGNRLMSDNLHVYIYIYIKLTMPIYDPYNI